MELLSSLALFATAGSTVLLGARHSHIHRGDVRNRSGHLHVAADDIRHQAQSLTACQAALFPVFGSVALLTLYVAFRYIDYLLVLYMFVMSAGSLAYLLNPVSQALLSGNGAACCRLSRYALNTAIAVGITLFWALTGHWAANNAIGCAICVVLMSTLKLPGLKVAAIALAGLLIYDVVWVFYVHQWFNLKQSVMVEVATQQASNPAAALVDAIPGAKEMLTEAYMPAPKLSMPNKLSLPVYLWLPFDPQLAGEAVGESGAWAVLRFPSWAGSLGRSMLVFAGYTFLGLGDIALPGMLLALAHRVDCEKVEAAAGPAVQERVDADVSAGARDVEEGKASMAMGDDDAAGLHGDASSGGHDEPAERQPLQAAAASGVGLQLRRGAPAAAVAPTSEQAFAPPPDSDRDAREAAHHGLRALARDLWGGLTDTLVKPTYLRVAFIGYMVGLVLAIGISRVFHAAQPALLYLVPCTLGPMVLEAWRRRELRFVWEGHAVPRPTATQ